MPRLECPAEAPIGDTPPSHTLASVLSRLRQGGATDPALAARLDRAFSKHLVGLTRYCAKELWPLQTEVVDEIVQDVLLVAWRKLPEFQPEHPFRAFLFGIAANLCANARRKRRDALTEDGVLDDACTARSALASMLAAERNTLVETAAANVLDALDQEMVYLRYVLDYPLEPIARQLGLSDPNEVRVALQRSRRRMIREIERLVAERGHGLSLVRDDPA